MIQFHDFGIDVQTYAERGKEYDFPLLKKCPHCRAKRPLHRHGYYERNALTPHGDYRIWIVRYRCRECLKTVSVLPSFLLPYFQYTLSAIWQVVKEQLGLTEGDEPGSVSPDKGRHHLLCPAVLPKPIKPSQLFCEAVEDHRPYREKRKGTGFLVDPDVGETRSLFGHQRHVGGRIPTPFCESNGILILHTYPKLEMVEVPTNLSYRRRKSDPVR